MLSQYTTVHRESHRKSHIIRPGYTNVRISTESEKYGPHLIGNVLGDGSLWLRVSILQESGPFLCPLKAMLLELPPRLLGSLVVRCSSDYRIVFSDPC